MKKFYVEYENYTMYYAENADGKSVSCIGNFESIRKGGNVKELTYERPSVGKYSGSSFTSDDYGPQRVCSICGVKMIEKWDGWQNVYEHPGENCETYHVYEHPYWRKDHLLHACDGRIKTKVGTPVSGVVNHDPLGMDDLDEIYNNLTGKDSEWRIANIAEIKKIYSDYADDAGQSELEVHVASYEDEDGNVIDPLENSEKGLSDADSEIFDCTEYSKEEINFINYLCGGRKTNFTYCYHVDKEKHHTHTEVRVTGKNRNNWVCLLDSSKMEMNTTSHVGWKVVNGNRGMILRSTKKALAKLKETPMRIELKEYYREILTYIIARGYFHPETCRWIRSTNKQTIMSSFTPKPKPKEEIEEEPKLIKKIRIIKAWNKIPVEWREDWERQSRIMEQYVWQR